MFRGNNRRCTDDVIPEDGEERERNRGREREGERRKPHRAASHFFSIQIIINLSLLRLDVDGGRFSASSYSSPLLFFSVLCQIC